MSDPRRWRIVDAFLILLMAAYTLLALHGVLVMSSNGVELDSDLGMYACATVVEKHPQAFVADPTFGLQSHAFWNVLRGLSLVLTPGQEYGAGLLYAGAVAVFVFYAGFYLLGRWLLGNVALALFLTLTTGITIWVGWGTFWGVVHSDPVPRVFFAAFYPFLIWGAVTALRRVRLRPLVMLATGACVFAHNISTLAAGAMFFMAFFLRRQGQSWPRHCLNCVLCLVAFFLPVLVSLSPLLLAQAHVPDADSLQVFKQLFEARLAPDYGQLWTGLWEYLKLCTFQIPIFPLAVLGWGIIMVTTGGGTPEGSAAGSSAGGSCTHSLCRDGQSHAGGLADCYRQRLRDLAGMYPAMLLALVLVAGLSLAEMELSRRLGRVPLGYELLRGTRLLVPLSWLMLAGGLACLWWRIHRVVRWALLLALVVLLFLLSHDRWHVGAVYSLSSWSGITLPQTAEAQATAARNTLRREALSQLQKLTPEGEVVFSSNGDQAIRYIARRGIFYTYKDGLAPYYDQNAANAVKSVDRARVWLHYHELMQGGPTAYVQAWLASGTRWLLCHRPQDRALLEQHGRVVWENAHWLIVERI